MKQAAEAEALDVGNYNTSKYVKLAIGCAAAVSIGIGIGKFLFGRL